MTECNILTITFNLNNIIEKKKKGIPINEDEELLLEEDEYNPNVVPLMGHDESGNIIYNIDDIESDSLDEVSDTSDGDIVDSDEDEKILNQKI
jgi:hypothetical protein